MTAILSRYKKQCSFIGIALAVVLFAVYLHALFQQGLWHRDAFLYKQDNGSYIGSDMLADYKMSIEQTDDGTDILFSVNDETKHYNIIYDLENMAQKVKVLENNELIFEGNAHRMGEEYILMDDDFNMADEIVIYVDGQPLNEKNLFPGYTKLYNWAVSNEHDIRGNPAMLIIILISVVILLLDIKCPDLFWLLEHGLDVDGGEPSDWYRFGQKAGRIITIAVIIICIITTFTTR
ncbi:MAG: hypothetical protein IJD30_03940 [Clostridia bacterium]|nr:hypothetical protein [Clostridia bacterium]